jgi:nucleoid-associated protein YgaU
LIVGFSLFLVLGVLISDHFSKARQVELAENIQPSSAKQMGGAVAPGLRTEGGPASPIPLTSGAGQIPRRTDLVPLPTGPSIRGPQGETPTQLAMGPRAPLSPLVDVNGHVGDVAPHVTLDDARHPQEESAAGASQIPVQKYEVKSGDTLYRIAVKSYGDSKLVGKLRDYNKLGADGTIHEGATILIPPKDVLLGKPYVAGKGAADAASGDAKSSDGYREYVVKSGDTLVGIARKMLGGDGRYTEIEQANPGVEAESLKVGMKLRIPAN